MTALANRNLRIPQIPRQVAALMALNGKFVRMTTRRDLKVRKGEQAIEKVSDFTCRVGVDYNNIAAVKEKRENGELPETPQPLPWGQWLIFPFVIFHNGNHYFRCTTVKNENSKPEVHFYRNGVEISHYEAKASALASEFPAEKPDNDVFTVKVESITAINGKAIETYETGENKPIHQPAVTEV